ncbi:cupin domain-containing protein [Pseudoalteromonas sp. MMG005]|uniref:cupin domain-containing protein n=1 Tax=Pseudoalteromonas sp. MMG005 TaxID=2822682 RepID=UPI001B3A5D27|nr:cupin domain-containing protein [Pseudoalteromonas sp. MMG005]MBQ4845490.1 cupin domain-containing protein [Pseudoalteromonas sp. MMG005]
MYPNTSNLNLDFSKRVTINTAQQPWLPSPLNGVERKPLAREHAESGHITSIVRYKAGASFTEHVHPFGEEILVLEGTFSDEHGDYPAGSYLRNPPGSKHTPFSKNGCTLFVKLNQFCKHDTQSLRINSNAKRWHPGQGNLQVLPLHSFETSHTALVKWPANEMFVLHKHYGGEEVLVLSGQLKDEHGSYPIGTWIRNPHCSQHQPFVEEDTVIFVKTGHLPS